MYFCIKHYVIQDGLSNIYIYTHLMTEICNAIGFIKLLDIEAYYALLNFIAFTIVSKHFYTNYLPKTISNK